MLREVRRLYLAVGEEVIHLAHPEWGVGKVIEELNSTVAGGSSMVRVEFANLEVKTFNNDVDSPHCCYHAGVRRH
ncbi:MAG: DUF3553 domain-containing protein [Thermodesulfobacteriota bacterium]